MKKPVIFWHIHVQKRSPGRARGPLAQPRPHPPSSPSGGTFKLVWRCYNNCTTPVLPASTDILMALPVRVRPCLSVLVLSAHPDFRMCHPCEQLSPLRTIVTPANNCHPCEQLSPLRTTVTPAKAGVYLPPPRPRPPSSLVE